MAMKKLDVWLGRDPWRDDNAWMVAVMVLPMASRLYRWGDEGHMRFAVLHVDLRVVWRTRTEIEDNLPGHLRVYFECWSDADEIATRIAEHAGQEVWSPAALT